MPFDELPAEILNHTLTFFEKPMLGAARSTSLMLNALATRHLFHNITFLPTESGLEKWHNITSDPKLRAVPRHAIINSSPIPDYTPWNSRGIEHTIISDWNPDHHDEKYESFYSGIDALSQLSSLDSATLHFMSSCRSPEGENMWDDDVELSTDRLDILTRFFKALQRRHKVNSTASKVTSLTIENLQNIPIEPFTTSKLFRSVMEDIEHLALEITEEYNEPGPDYDIYRPERRTFPPYLIAHWLKPIAGHLKSLTLEFPDCWGPLPGYFDFSGLDFPRLETLTLRRYCIGHDDALDWIFHQPLLKTLHLDDSQILTYASLDPESNADWSIHTHDWTRETMPPDHWTAGTDHRLYSYGGTWAKMLTKIRNQATHLTEFTFRCDSDRETFRASSTRPEHWTTGSRWREDGDEGKQVTEMPEWRYVTFDIGLLPTQWLPQGEFSIEQLVDEEGNVGPLRDRSQETQEEDKEALSKLLREVAARKGKEDDVVNKDEL